MRKLFISLTLIMSFGLLTACGGGGGSDNSTDTATDTPADTGTDTPADTGTDTPADTGTDTPADTGTDTPADTGTDTPADTGTDTPTDTGSGTGTQTPTNGVIPIVPLTSEGTLELGNDGSLLSEAGSQGLIISEITEETFGEFTIPSVSRSLAPGVPSLNIENVQRTQVLDFDCSSIGPVESTVMTNFSTGIENASGSADGQSLSCTTTYEVILPMTISTPESIESLLVEYGGDTSSPTVLSTTCPTGNDDSLDVDPAIEQCNGTVLTNYTITDDSGVEHKISERSTIDF